MVKLADTIDLGSIASACRFKSCYPHQQLIYWLIAQSVEHATVNRRVVGSSPTLPANPRSRGNHCCIKNTIRAGLYVMVSMSFRQTVVLTDTLDIVFWP